MDNIKNEIKKLNDLKEKKDLPVEMVNSINKRLKILKGNKIVTK